MLALVRGLYIPYLIYLVSKQQIFDIIAEFNRTDTTHM